MRTRGAHTPRWALWWAVTASEPCSEPGVLRDFQHPCKGTEDKRSREYSDRDLVATPLGCPGLSPVAFKARRWGCSTAYVLTLKPLRPFVAQG